MNTSNDNTIYLTSADDWEAWNLQFQAKAVAGDIWNQIQGHAPFLRQPTAPDPARHRHKAPSQSTATVRSSVAPTEEDPVEAGPSQDNLSRAIEISDLTADGFRTYQLEWTIYQSNNKKYIQQTEHVGRLKE